MTTSALRPLVLEKAERALVDREVDGTLTISELTYNRTGPGQLADDAPRLARRASQFLRCRVLDGVVYAASDVHRPFEPLDGVFLRREYAATLVSAYKHDVPPTAAFDAAAAELCAQALKIHAERAS